MMNWGKTKAGEVLSDVKSGDWGTAEPSADTVPVRVIRGTDFPQAAASRLTEVPVRYVRTGRYESRRLQPGDLLIEMSGGSKKQATGRALLVTEPLLAAADYPVAYSNFVKRVRPPESMDPEFVWLQWQYLYQRGRTRIYERRTTGIRNFKLDAFLENEDFVIPPLPEQRAIAHVLRTVQRAREQTEQVITAARELKRSLRQYLFTHGVIPVQEQTQVVVSQTGIGMAPSRWPVQRLNKLLREPLRNGRSAPATATANGVRTLTLSAVTNDNFSIQNTKVTSAKTAEVQDLWLEPGDIFVERSNTRELVGTAALYEGPSGFAIFPDLLIRVRVDEDRLLPKYAAEYLKSEPVRLYFRRSASGTAGNMPKIDQRVLGETPLPVAPPTEQEALTRTLAAVDRKVAAEVQRRDALTALFSSLLYDAMTARLRVDQLAAGFA